MVRSAELGTATIAQCDTAQRPKTLSVCHIVSGDLWAGAEVQAAALIQGLSRRDDMRVSAILLNEGRPANELGSCGVEVCVIPESSNGFRQILKAAEGFLRNIKPDVLHSHRYKENLLALLLARKCGVPVTVRTQHGWPEPVKGLKALHHAGVLWLDRFSGRRWGDAVICVSAEMMPRLQRIYGSRTVLVRNAIDTSAVVSHLSREQAKRRLQIPIEAPLIGIVGRLEPIKRVDLFLETARLFLQRVPSAHFAIVGTGSCEQQLKAQSAALTLDGRIHFLGHRDDVYEVLRALDTLVMCSDSEGMPMVLLEALWLGAPVVGRKVGGIKEVLGDNECGLAVDSLRPEDFSSAIESLLHDAELCKRLREAAVKRIEEEFSLARSIDDITREYWRLYQSATAMGEY